MKIYVDASARCDGDGSEFRPFKRINEAAKIAVAGDDQVIGQATYGLLQPDDQRLAVPVEQALVLAADALATAAGQQQDRAGKYGGIRHARLCQGLCGAVI